ncbi:hypothetical protein B0H13DRAFT_2099109 [Mycena leptocephala]|nr:hypothetical protein B0H13DRAFT_2099109 [Mycena leptocephala]
MSDLTTIPELLIQIFEHLPLRDLISASHVDSQWRALAPQVDSPIRTRLLGLAFESAESVHPISLSIRTCYVDTVEKKYNVRIPEPYRTILTEWPASQPPSGMHWPHSVRFHASGFCFCGRNMREFPEECYCTEGEVRDVSILIPGGIFRTVMDEGRVSQSADHRWELFDNGVRLRTEEQNTQTVRFIRAQSTTAFRWTRDWASADFKVLELSRYHLFDVGRESEGVFVMILDGPTRGQIHGWSSSGSNWYDGFEAESFWDWKYSEWDPEEMWRESDGGDED